MQSAMWTKCRKPVITAFCLFYAYFTLLQTLPKQWSITDDLLATLPEATKTLGLTYLLTLFSTQQSHYSYFAYRIHFQNGDVIDWTYPGEEALFDRQLYARIFSNYMGRIRNSPALKKDFARFLIRKYDSISNHPVLIECQETIQHVPAPGLAFAPAVVKQFDAYAVESQDLPSNAGAGESSPGLLDK